MNDALEPRTRRRLLITGAGGLAAAALAALGRPVATRAANNDAVLVGNSYSGTATTTLSVSAAQPAFAAVTTATSGSADGLRGESHGAQGIGVYGIARDPAGLTVGVRGDTISGSGTGVFGMGGTVGVQGYSADPYGSGVVGMSHSATSGQASGVRGTSDHASSTGVYAQNTSGGTGLLGISGLTVPALAAETGVLGYAAASPASVGVYGRSTVGRGVKASTDTGVGLYATATTGTALQAVGAVRFSTSGKSSIAKGTRSRAVASPVVLTSASKVFVALMGAPGGTTSVQRVAVNTTAKTFTVYLTANATAATAFAWFVIS